MTEQEIFEQARNLDQAERHRFLIQVCRGDAQKRQRIEDLLTAYQKLGSFLDMPAAGPETCDMPPVAEVPGCSVGPYKLLQRIGEGGFGVVYMAEQTEPVRRKVALKIIKPGMDTKEVIARFESERQALALMDHPNIARVLDAGATDSGRPYFVMELVKGVPVTEFCDKNSLDITERMKLFIPVCLAVQHAHHKGIIHRDLKPSNVMVTLHDGVPVAKVIDFGVAKATSQQLTQRTLFTAYGQMIGTPLYMSPEQAEMSGLDIDTRSDIYSLGVLLYELLTGTTPLEMKQLREAGFVEMQRLIREVEAPRPSTRLSTLRQDASIICSKRGADAKRLSDLLRGEVDWIVMKALEKDRQRRYDTPTAFANDIQRFLNHEAIEARPPSTSYRLQKFVQRNRALAVGVACVAAALLLGVIVSTGLAIYANTQLAGRIAAESRLKNSLDDAQQERARQTALAEQRRVESEAARQAESEQRAIADQQRQQAEKLKEETIARNTQLQQLTEEQRRTIYASDMNLVRIEAQRGNLTRMREILMDQLPIDGKPDLRGFEWNYWYRFLNQAKVLMKVDNFQFGKPGSAAAVVPGGEWIAVTSGKTTEIKNIDSGVVIGSLPEPLRLLVNRTRFSETGRSVHGGANSNEALWLNYPRVVSDGFSVYEPTGERRSFEYPADSFSHVSFLNISPDGKRVVALGNAKEYISEQPACRVIVWDVESNAIVLNQVLSRQVNRIEFSPDGMRVAAHLCKGSQLYSNDHRDVIVVLDVSTGEELGVARHNDEIDSVFWLPDGQRLLLATLSFSGSNRKELLTWTIGEARPTRLSHELIPDYVKGAVSPDGRLIAITGHTAANIRIFDTFRGDLVDTLHHEATTIDTVTFSKDGQRIVACSTSGTIIALAFSEDNQQVITLNEQLVIKNWNLRDFSQFVSGVCICRSYNHACVIHGRRAPTLAIPRGQRHNGLQLVSHCWQRGTVASTPTFV
jgi:serine/threonine protein kinase/Tol biopolymer transport system component